MTATADHIEAQRRTTMLVAIVIIGFVLRIAAARGDYWLDEAWSALYARDAGTPGRIFFAINHDNNHYLNTLWLQAVGWGSPAMLGRALSIACGTATIGIAWLIGERRGLAAAAIGALLFAVSPILVTYGSEARGYAPMLLALLIAIWIVDRELFGMPLRRAPEWLGLVALLGMLAHVSMLFGVAALIGWVAIEQSKRLGLRSAARATIGLTGRMILAITAVLALIAIGAMASPTGFRMGILTGFTWPDFADALAYMLAFTVGWPLHPGFWLLPILLLPLLLWRLPALHDRAAFHLIAIIGLPLLVALLHPDNAAIPRYYLLSAIALLLLAADLLAAARPMLRYAMIPLIFAGSVTIDLGIGLNRRADPGDAIIAMRERAPDGATVLIDDVRDSPVLEAAAASRGYRLRIAEGCMVGELVSDHRPGGGRGDDLFLFVERNHDMPSPANVARCGAIFETIASNHVYGLSGMDWQLYQRTR